MKHTKYILTAIALILSFASSTAQIKLKVKPTKVKASDFVLKRPDLAEGAKAVLLEETAETYLTAVPILPWDTIQIYPGNMNRDVRCWATYFESKTLILTDEDNNTSATIIEYPNVKYNKFTPMRHLNLWIYELDQKGKVKKRAVKKEEIVHQRVNDSIVRIKIETDENLKGKIIVKKYDYLHTRYEVEPETKIIDTHIFQRDIPVMYASYYIDVPIWKSTLWHRKYKSDPPTPQSRYFFNLFQEGRGYLQIKKEEGLSRFDGYRTYRIHVVSQHVLPKEEGDNTEPLGIKVITMYPPDIMIKMLEAKKAENKKQQTEQ